MFWACRLPNIIPMKAMIIVLFGIDWVQVKSKFDCLLYIDFLELLRVMKNKTCSEIYLM